MRVWSQMIHVRPIEPENAAIEVLHTAHANALLALARVGGIDYMLNLVACV